jgi:hypothetical protein
MVDSSTVENPDWRDLNLALNVYAKAGYVPWVLDEAMPGVDLFVGLSAAQIRRADRTDRMMGYANVFDSYGRWKFYQGDSAAFSYDDRLGHFVSIVKDSIAAFRAGNGNTLETVVIHLTKCFSKAERLELARAVRDVSPGSSVVFVWVNPYHSVRLFDLSHADGQIARSTYLPVGKSRVYLATTGTNVYGQKGMGTAIPLELTIWADPPDALPQLSEVAQQVLSLTRLNWASSNSFCQEPITTKFAGAIAKYMVDFLDDPSFSVNPSLRDTPWFL